MPDVSVQPSIAQLLRISPLTVAKAASGFGGAAAGYLFPINGNNISPDRGLFFTGASFIAGLSAGEYTNNKITSKFFGVAGLTSALTFKILEELCSSYTGASFLTRFLIAGFAPMLIEKGGSTIYKMASNTYNWWHRPSPGYQNINQEDLEAQLLP
jgi:hypothetical protein